MDFLISVLFESAFAAIWIILLCISCKYAWEIRNDPKNTLTKLTVSLKKIFSKNHSMRLPLLFFILVCAFPLGHVFQRISDEYIECTASWLPRVISYKKCILKNKSLKFEQIGSDAKIRSSVIDEYLPKYPDEKYAKRILRTHRVRSFSGESANYMNKLFESVRICQALVMHSTLLFIIVFSLLFYLGFSFISNKGLRISCGSILFLSLIFLLIFVMPLMHDSNEYNFPVAIMGLLILFPLSIVYYKLLILEKQSKVIKKEEQVESEKKSIRGILYSLITVLIFSGIVIYLATFAWSEYRRMYFEAALILGSQEDSAVLSYNQKSQAAGINELVASYKPVVQIIAGAGNLNNKSNIRNGWKKEFENNNALEAELSEPHLAIADGDGNIYIADTAAHAIRMISPDGIIRTVAGINQPGKGSDVSQKGTACALNYPNGLFINSVGIVYILDLNNKKIRRLSKDGSIKTLIPSEHLRDLKTGRGLWINDDETLAYIASGTSILRWTPETNINQMTSPVNFINLANLAVDPQGCLVVTDRGANCVYRITKDGHVQQIAGNKTTKGGGNGQHALDTGLHEVRGVWFLENGSYFLCTHRGHEVWYVDTNGVIHTLVAGSGSDHQKDAYFSVIGPDFSEPRAITVDSKGNILITENDKGYVRIIKHR